MAKRNAQSELNHDNWDQEDESEEAGEFKKATADQMKVVIFLPGSCLGHLTFSGTCHQESQEEKSKRGPEEKHFLQLWWILFNQQRCCCGRFQFPRQTPNKWNRLKTSRIFRIYVRIRKYRGQKRRCKPEM